MDNIVIPASERAPAVDFDFAAGILKLKGESYPEDVASFFGPPMSALATYLDGLSGTGVVRFDIELIYFNSSSAKVLMNIMLLLEKAGKAGNEVVVNWYFNSDDDTMQEFGEDFSEDLERVRFNLCAIEAA